MLTVYSSDLCPDCRECKKNFDAHNIPYTLVDINESMRTLKEFLKLRDTRAEFDEVKARGSVGIPALVDDDGGVCFDWEQYLTERGLPIVYKEERPAFCSIDGKNC